MQRPRRLQMHSCDACRRRKIRCDSVSKEPCSACVKAGVACRFAVGWRRRKRQQTPPPFADTPSITSHDINDDNLAPRSGRNQRVNDTSKTALSPSLEHHQQQRLHYIHESPLTLSDQAHAAPSSAASSAPAQAENLASIPNPSFPATEVTTSLALAQTSLFRFFREGISSSSYHWEVFDQTDRVRVVYVGTHISNMTHLIKLDRPASPTFLIYPYPQIHAPLAWKPESEGTSTSGNILCDVMSFPAKDIRDDFIEAFFTKIHPYFPVMDEAEFRTRYADPNNQPPLLLFHAVLLAGAHVSEHPRVIQARHVVKAVLFSRAKQVFDMRHENDRLHLVQAALLFTLHLQNGDTASANSWFWLGVACRIAIGLGMHRNILHDPPNPDRMPLADRRLWRRTWWTLFQAETMSALEHGRPPMIRLEDFDQDRLTMEDLIESDGAINTKIDLEYCVRNIELCYIALEVMSLSAPRSAARQHNFDVSTSNLTSRLASWMLKESNASDGKSLNDSFCGLNLRLHYNMVVIHLYRVITDRPMLSGGRQFEEAMKISTSAATTIISTLETIHAKKMMAQCHFPAVTALTAAAIQAAKELQRAVDDGNPMLAISEWHLLDRVCTVAQHLSEFWPNAEGVGKVFRSLFDKFTGVLNAGMQWNNNNHVDPVNGTELAGTDMNWADILGSSLWMHSGQGVQEGDEEWEASLFALAK
ncbi:hypothetical protein A1O1_05437 [Capronia coronata CBS 617.96]|uniref:Zn(2)-C6 fungal-type domain-containing protein n=1 Tax=Capronia coronata CBS 617.96 TaxID=1182541 RepID=W9Y6P8_9EURO|nr:uncharacterized protein A1O1_05437 [Capronia coronata CBS 617.96]EXJ88507.1 hypothetical protein A1O1_05437 [Capronia coronata CBS 617.96]